jgi:hypothetical protein
LSKFSRGDEVATFDPNFQPLVLPDSTGIITKVYDDSTRTKIMGPGYDVRLLTEEGTFEEFYFHEFELTEVK